MAIFGWLARPAARTSRPVREMRERPGTALLAPELMARVRQIQIRTHRLVSTALSGGYRSTFRGSGLEFQEVRAYQPGDEVRRIDWNVTARTGDAYVKNYAEERELTINFIVDTSRSMGFGSRLQAKAETAADFCALLALVAIRHQDKVGLVLFGEHPGLHLPAKKSGQHVLRIIREVRFAEPLGRSTDFAAVLEHQSRVLRRRSVVFLVSDFQVDDAGTPAANDWSERLGKLALRHDVIAVRIRDRLEEELESAGLVDLEELESGARLTLDTRSKAVREAWRQAAAQRRARVDQLFARARVDVIDLDTSERDIGRPILSFFRRRALRHGGKR
jgi:uncharacterized protein (DUF58 family)